MGERLEGILSEAILDEIASDLGVDPDDMRKHPFFRVLKGQVLLTYPLRVQAPQFTPYAYSAALAAGAYFVPAEKTIVMVAALGVAQDLSIYYGNYVVKQGAESLGVSELGYIGATFCDGTYVKYRNDNVAEKSLVLTGVSMT